MPYSERTKLVRENMIQAESALDSYVQSGVNNPEQRKQLAEALKVSRDEYVDQLERLFPKMS